MRINGTMYLYVRYRKNKPPDSATAALDKAVRTYYSVVRVLFRFSICARAVAPASPIMHFCSLHFTWVKDFSEGVLWLGDSLCAMRTVRKAPHQELLKVYQGWVILTGLCVPLAKPLINMGERLFLGGRFCTT